MPTPPAPRRLAALLLAALLGGCTAGDDKPPKDTDTEDTAGTTTTVEEEEGICQVSMQCFGNVLDDPKAPCSLRVASPGGTVLYDGAAGVELRGRSSLGFPKPQYALELRDHTELPVWPGSVWRYLDDGSNPGTAWRNPSFDDGGWGSGPAPLGYGLPYLQTPVSAPGGSATVYYRTTFTLGDRSQIADLDLGVKRVDGVAVYLNGVEVLRDNLPAQAAFDTPAVEASPDRSFWRQSDVDESLLVDGDNVLAVEVHRASAGIEESSFDLYLEAKGEDAPTNLLGMGKAEDWILNGQYVDRVLFRNRLAYDMFQELGGVERYATETRFCELELNGEYRGIYTLGESIQRDDDRLDIGKGDQPGDTFIVKNDDVGQGIHDNQVGYGFWQLVYPDASDAEAVDTVSATLAGWEASVLAPDPGDMFAWMDLDSAVDWVLLNEFMKNRDAYLLSVHLWRDQGQPLRFTPWDLDLSMGSYPFDDCTAQGWVSRTYLDLQGVEHDIPFIQKMAEVPAFRDRLVTRWQELRAGPWSDQAIADHVAHYDELLAPVLDANVARWPVEDIVFSTYGVDDWLCPVSSYQEEHDHVMSFISERLAWMDANISTF
ncbi:MAG: CotH kinase family protein [Myxococcota bacterium]